MKGLQHFSKKELPGSKTAEDGHEPPEDAPEAPGVTHKTPEADPKTMKKSTAKKNKTGKRLLGLTILAAAAAAGLVISGIFSSPKDIVTQDFQQPAPVVETITLPPDNTPEPESPPEEARKKKKTLKELMTEKLLSLPVAVRALVILPLYLLGNLLGGLLSLVGSGLGKLLAPLALKLLTWLVFALLLLAGIVLALKLLYPDKSLKELLSLKTILPVIVTTLVLWAANEILPLWFPGYLRWKKILIRTAALCCGCLVIIPAAIEISRAGKTENSGIKNEVKESQELTS